MKSKIPKIICGISATISIAVLGFLALPSLWFWVCWEIIAAALVAVGCAGEWYLFLNPAKEGHESFHRRRELQFISAVAIGVTMEFLALSHAIPEALRLEKEVKSLESNNSQLALRVEELRLKNEELEAAVGWRDINPQQRKHLMQLLGLLPKRGNVLVTCHDLDKEACFFAKRINDVLTASNFKSRFDARQWFENPGSGLHITVKDPLNFSELARLIADAFEKVGVPMECGEGHIKISSRATMITNAPITDLDRAYAYLNVDTWNWSRTGSKDDATNDDAVIFVGNKPTPK